MSTERQELESVIGLEVHVQLKTRSGMFCSCAVGVDDAPPNTHICPVCLGMLGALPLINKKAVEYCVKYGLATDCAVASHSRWDRKNYFYPDLPKGYQISQLDLPLCSNGKLDLTRPDGSTFTIRINRIHLEEDAAKTTHKGDKTLVDFNRSGTPLSELVTEPDLRSVEDAGIFLRELRRIVRYIGVADADMEKGHLRCDASISLRPFGEDKLYPRTEVKNINSFRNVERALAYEINRQTKLWKDGDVTTRETTAQWDDAKQETRVTRDKEGSADYRYFPEPDIPEVELNRDFIEELRATIPELPASRRSRYAAIGISGDDALAIADEKEVADYFDEAIGTTQKASPPKSLVREIAKWFTGPAFEELKATELADIKMTPAALRAFAAAVVDGSLPGVKAKEVFPRVLAGSADLDVEIRAAKDAAADIDLGAIVEKVLADNQPIVEQYKAGKEAALNALIGPIIKETGGTIPAPEVVKALKKKLG